MHLDSVRWPLLGLVSPAAGASAIIYTVRPPHSTKLLYSYCKGCSYDENIAYYHYCECYFLWIDCRRVYTALDDSTVGERLVLPTRADYISQPSMKPSVTNLSTPCH